MEACRGKSSFLYHFSESCIFFQIEEEAIRLLKIIADCKTIIAELLSNVD